MRCQRYRVHLRVLQALMDRKQSAFVHGSQRGTGPNRFEIRPKPFRGVNTTTI